MIVLGLARSLHEQCHQGSLGSKALLRSCPFARPELNHLWRKYHIKQISVFWEMHFKLRPTKNLIVPDYRNRIGGPMWTGRLAAFAAVTAVIASLAFSDRARALPSFARQTGQPCGTCHTDFPALTPFGRSFKLRGYIAGGGQAEKQSVYKAGPRLMSC